MKAITLHSVVPVRKEPSERAEMVTQLLFAETFEVLQNEGTWVQVKNDADGYEGWVSEKMISRINDEVWAELQSMEKALVAVPVTLAVSQENSTSIFLTGGTKLPNYTSNGTFQLLGITFRVDPQTIVAKAAFTQERFMQLASYYMNIPYLWGGKNAFGIDCSGFVQVLMSLFGVDLPRDASQQINYGENVDFLTEAKAGDLAFFENEQGNIIHVGIMIDSERVMHASGRVKISAIDTEGILSDEKDGYTHKLRIVKRVIE